MFIIEKIANALGRPFGLDFYIGKWCGWLDFAAYELGVSRGKQEHEASKLWVGPVQFAVCRV